MQPVIKQPDESFDDTVARTVNHLQQIDYGFIIDIVEQPFTCLSIRLVAIICNLIGRRTLQSGGDTHYRAASNVARPLSIQRRTVFTLIERNLKNSFPHFILA